MYIYEDVKYINEEIEKVAEVMVSTAQGTLPLVHSRGPVRWTERELSSLCAKSRAARST